MDITIRSAAAPDIPALARMFQELVDSLQTGPNYCGWGSVYPTRQDAENSVSAGGVYFAEINGELAGSVWLNHHQEATYAGQPWLYEAENDRILVIHTLAVHPRYQRRGVASRLLETAADVAAKTGCAAIRLDVAERNTPAIRVYERAGYRYVSTVDLGLPEEYDLKWFRLYERPVKYE